MAARVRWQGSTTQRGYGWDHVKERARQIALWQPGQPCTRCGQPIWHLSVMTVTGHRISTVDLAHTPDRTAYEGLQHRRCNRAEGATRGNLLRNAAKGWASARNW